MRNALIANMQRKVNLLTEMAVLGDRQVARHGSVKHQERAASVSLLFLSLSLNVTERQELY